MSNNDLPSIKATGTTLTDLNTAVSVLTDENFLKSTLVINGTILKPSGVTNKEYLIMGPTSNTSNACIGTNYSPSNGANSFTKALAGTLTDTAITVTSWSLMY